MGYNVMSKNHHKIKQEFLCKITGPRIRILFDKTTHYLCLTLFKQIIRRQSDDVIQ